MASTKKVAFVTGAGSGIGRAGAIAFAEAGYAVVLVDRDEAALGRTQAVLTQQGAESVIAVCDVASDASVEAAVGVAESAYGRLDAAFNAAGIDGAEGTLTADATLANWDRVIAIDLSGVFYCMRHQLRLMLKSGGGSIVNVSSVAGIAGAPTFSAYTAAKHGVVGLTRTAALEYGKQKIRVNAICPGSVDTPMTKALDPKIREWMENESPVGRFAQPEEMAATAVFLASDGAAYLTGQAIAVDGAWTAR